MKALRELIGKTFDWARITEVITFERDVKNVPLGQEPPQKMPPLTMTIRAEMFVPFICDTCHGTGVECYRTGYFLLDVAFRPCTDRDCRGRGEWTESFRIL